MTTIPTTFYILLSLPTDCLNFTSRATAKDSLAGQVCLHFFSVNNFHMLWFVSSRILVLTRIYWWVSSMGT